MYLALLLEGEKYIIHVHSDSFACCTDLLRGQKYVETSPTAKVNDYFALEDIRT